MSLKEKLFLSIIDNFHKDIIDIRDIEMRMIGFSIIIFGASTSFAFITVVSPLKFLTSLFTSVMLIFIGLFIARYNELEQVYSECLNRIYRSAGVSYYDYKPRAGYARRIETLAYGLLVIVSLALAFYFGATYPITLKMIYSFLSLIPIYWPLLLVLIVLFLVYFYHYASAMFPVNLKDEIKLIQRNKIKRITSSSRMGTPYILRRGGVQKKFRSSRHTAVIG